MDRVAELFLKRRAAAVVVLALTALALVGATRVRVDDLPSNLFRSTDAEFVTLEETWRDFGSDDNDVLVLVTSDDLFTPDAIRALRDLVEAIGGIDGVGGVSSLLDLFQPATLPPLPVVPSADAGDEALAGARAAALAHPLGAGRLLSDDGRATLVNARIIGNDLPIGELRERVGQLEAALESVDTRGAVDLSLTGIPPLRVVIFDTIRREQGLFAVLAGIIGVLVGLLIFRRIAPVLVTITASGVSSLWALGAMGWAGVPLDLLTAELPLLVLVIAYTDAVHLVVHVLRRRAEGIDAKAAADSAVRALTLPCALTSLTTAIGFTSLGFSRVDAIRNFGLLFAAAVAMTFVAVLTVVPLLSLWMPTGKPRKPSAASRRLGMATERLVRATLKRARLVAVFAAVLTLVLSVLALGLKPESRLTEAVPRNDRAAQALGEVERHFGGSLWNAVLVRWPVEEGTDAPLPQELPKVLGELEAMLEAEPFAFGPLSARRLAGLLPSGPERLDALQLLPTEVVSRLLRPDLGKALVPYRVPDAGAIDGDPAYARLATSLQQVAERHPDFELTYTGTGFVARRNVNIVIADFRDSLLGASAVILLVLAVAFRSLRLGLVSIIPNMLPLALAGAGLALFGVELQVASVLAFTICLGIAVDDTIHLLARYQHERRAGTEPVEAAVNAFLHVGRALAITTAVLVGGFAVMTLSTIATTVLFAIIAVVALLAALLGDLVFLPALLVATERAEPAARPAAGPAPSDRP